MPPQSSFEFSGDGSRDRAEIPVEHVAGQQPLGIVIGDRRCFVPPLGVVFEMLGDKDVGVDFPPAHALHALLGRNDLPDQPHGRRRGYLSNHTPRGHAAIHVAHGHRQLPDDLPGENEQHGCKTKARQHKQKDQIEPASEDSLHFPQHREPKASGPFLRTSGFALGRHEVAPAVKRTLIPGRNPGTGFCGTARTSNVFRSKSPLSLVARHVAKSPSGEM